MNVNKQILTLPSVLRLEVLFGAVASCWLMVFLAFFVEPAAKVNPALRALGLELALFVTFIIACSLAIAAVLLNNLLDTRYDKRFNPHHSDRFSLPIRARLTICLVLFLIAIFTSSMLGLAAIVGVLIVCSGVIFYNIAGRFMPPAAVITLAVIYGIIMIIPNFQLIFAWPIALVVTHIMICSTVRMNMAGSKIKLHHLDVMWIVLAWLFLMMLLIALMHSRKTSGVVLAQSRNMAWLGPFISASLFAIIAFFISKIQIINNRAKAKYFVIVSNLWLIVYAIAWLFSFRLYWQAALIALLFVIAVGVPISLKVFTVRSKVSYKLDIDRPVKV